MRYLSLCSGIEAATVAWHPLGWTPVAFSQFDPEHNYKNGPDFPSAVLAHHYPSVPNLGDMTKIDSVAFRGKVDLLVGGTPCQSFSLAGLRKGLDDARGNLTLTYVQLVKETDPKYSIWENVPGVLSDATNAFGCLLAGLCGASDPLVPPGKSGKPGKWPDAGVVAGPERWAAWRIIDAQGFDPQRRRRVFVVSTRAADRLDPGRVLFEAEADLERYLGDRASAGPLFPVRQSLRGDLAPGREAGKSVAGSLAARTRGCGGLGTDFDIDGGLLLDRGGDAGGSVTTWPILEPGARTGVSTTDPRAGMGIGSEEDPMFTLQAGKQHGVGIAFGGNNTTGPIQVSTAINAHGGPHGCLDFESETFVLSSDFADYRPDEAAAAVRAKGGDAGGGSEVLVCHGTMDPCSQTERAFALGWNNGGENAVCIHSDAIARTGDSLTAGPDAEGRIRKRPAGKGFLTDGTAYNLTAASQPHAVCVTAFSCKDHGADAAQDIATTMRAMGHSGSHANAGGQLAVCISIHENQRGEISTNDTAWALKTGGGKPGQGYPAVCITGDVTHTLRAEGFDASEDGTGRGQPIVPWHGAKVDDQFTETDENIGVTQLTTLGRRDAASEGLRSGEALRAMRVPDDSKEDVKRGSGITVAFRQAEVLRSEMHGEELRLQGIQERGLVDDALPCSEASTAGALHCLRCRERLRCSSQGWGPHEQFAGEPRSPMSELPRQGAQDREDLHDLRGPAEGARAVQQASDPQAQVWGPACYSDAYEGDVPGVRGADAGPRSVREALHADEEKPAPAGLSKVRRLLPAECESLQGFPRGYTAIPWKKHAPEDCPDGPRYRALGNSMNAKVMNWIGRRIAMVEAEHSAAQDLFGDLPAPDAISLFDI